MKSNTASFGIVDSNIHKVDLVANKLAVLPGEEVEFTVTVTGDSGVPISGRIGEVWQNGAFKMLTCNDHKNCKPTDAFGKAKFKIRFDVPLVHQIDARFYNARPPYIVKSNIITIFV